jgi:hypothetical protein
MPCPTKYSFTALARRAPKARLYSRVPRSSQWPSILTRTPRIFAQPRSLALQQCLVAIFDLVLVQGEMHRIADIDAKVLSTAGQDRAAHARRRRNGRGVRRRRLGIDGFLLVGTSRQAGQPGKTDDPEFMRIGRHQYFPPEYASRQERTGDETCACHSVT